MAAGHCPALRLAKVASPHCWSLMLPTSARVAQEVYEPLIEIQHPMLCSRMEDTWQIGTTSIQEDHWIADLSTGAMLRPMCRQGKTQRTTLQYECINISKTTLPKQELTLMTFWPLQPPGKGPRIYAIISPLPARRLMQRLQSKLQAPRPSIASSFTGVNLS